MNKTKKKESFESSLGELETIVGALESGDKPLEESLSLFEKGIALSQALSRELEEAKHKVEVLMKEGTAYKKKPLDEQ